VKIIDVSMEIHPDMAVWKNKEEKRPQFEVTRDHGPDSPARETKVTLDMHTGTHIDAPLHFVANGETMESISLQSLIRPAKVFDLTAVEDSISREDLESLSIQSDDFVLFKTKSSFHDGFDPSFVFIDKTAADYLLEKGIAGVGTDGLGVERSQPDHETHRSLLGDKVVIIEGLRLAGVEAGEYGMAALPLKLKNVEAAPARVVLMQDDSEPIQ